MIIMAIDLGKARTGLAICDEDEILASPLEVIHEKNPENLTQKIIEKIKKTNPQFIIVGLPKNMDGTLGESANYAQKFANNLKDKINIPVKMWDERRTTITANEYLNSAKVSGRKKKSIIDAVSATIILESFLNSRKTIHNI